MGRGRGRGRGRKLAIARSHEDKGSSGEEVMPARKRRGRPQKRFTDKIDQIDVENFVDNIQKRFADKKDQADVQNFIDNIDGDDQEKNNTAASGNKRSRQLIESSNLVQEENNSGIRSSSDESTRTNGFRQNGNRRKSKPRRAAEAGLECKAWYRGINSMAMWHRWGLHCGGRGEARGAERAEAQGMDPRLRERGSGVGSGFWQSCATLRQGRGRGAVSGGGGLRGRCRRLPLPSAGTWPRPTRGGARGGESDRRGRG